MFNRNLSDPKLSFYLTDKSKIYIYRLVNTVNLRFTFNLKNFFDLNRSNISSPTSVTPMIFQS